MAFLIRVLEMGESQLMEPTPSDVGDAAVQEARRCLHRAQHIAAQLRDRALRGEPWWDLPMDLWEHLRRNTAPAAYIVERRGDAFQDPNDEEATKRARGAVNEPARGSNDPAPGAHPADVLTLESGGKEAEARTSTSTTAYLLLLEAAQALRDHAPFLGGSQAMVTNQMLHAVEQVGQTLFGGVLAAHSTTQTVHVDSQDTEPMEAGEAGQTTAAEAEEPQGGTALPTQTEETTQQNGGDTPRPDSCSLGSDMPGTETEDEAFGLDRRRRTTTTRGTETKWTTLAGITESQARPYMTASLEVDIQQLGEPTQGMAPTSHGGDTELPPTLPWTTEGHHPTGDAHQVKTVSRATAGVGCTQQGSIEVGEFRTQLYIPAPTLASLYLCYGPTDPASTLCSM